MKLQNVKLTARGALNMVIEIVEVGSIWNSSKRFLQYV